MAVIYFSSDHAGFAMKHALMEHVRTLGYETEDLGPLELDPEDDYPDFILPLAKRVAEEIGRDGDGAARGIVIGGSGQGEAMCANRVPGIRTAVFYGKVRAADTLDVGGGHSKDGFDIVRLVRRHNDANVLSLGARFISGEEADEAVRIFLDTPFSGDERHMRRIAKY